MKRLLLLLPLAFASCSSTPEFEHSSPAGVARADDRDDARMLAMMANLFAHEVCATLGVELAPPFVIEHLSGTDVLGIDVQRDSADRIVSRRIVIGDVPLRAQARFSVAHELVHWYASAPWDCLPHAIEEGLADYIAIQIAPEFRDVRTAELEQRLAEMTPARRAAALSVDEREWKNTPKSVRSDAYAVGFEIVRRFGIDGLRELCVRAAQSGHPRVPLDWIERAPSLPNVARH